MIGAIRSLRQTTATEMITETALRADRRLRTARLSIEQRLLILTEHVKDRVTESTPITDLDQHHPINRDESTSKTITPQSTSFWPTHLLTKINAS